MVTFRDIWKAKNGVHGRIVTAQVLRQACEKSDPISTKHTGYGGLTHLSWSVPFGIWRPARKGTPMSASEVPLSVDELFEHSEARSWRRFPDLFRRALAITWQAAPRQIAVTSALQVLAGVGLAVQVLIARQLLTVVLGEHRALSLHAALPSVIAPS